jgi:hypothetical protein
MMPKYEYALLITEEFDYCLLNAEKKILAPGSWILAPEF